ncbi:unnamed protein product [Medioppia subpectinata]|uniref:CWH43-like N-terminal domain-containing protein n=1 Tax=Medioppia subpectinata TaxID=1979941 RepID=A0A7R9LLQ9_9ACAR|nr:unnamed protein product [Medioppia subpectinata]CAG2119913.1 unnamed protein product [Medioppia subpectinata]
MKLLYLWGLSVHQGHSEPLMQFVSDLGAIAPEANIFTMVMAMEATMVFLFSAIRHGGLKAYIQSNTANINYNNNNYDNDAKVTAHRLTQYNKWSLVIGLVFGWALMGTASFRTSEGIIVLVVHGFHACIGFSLIMLDMGLQSEIAYARGRPWTGRFRRFLAVVSFTLILVMMVMMGWSLLELDNPFHFMNINIRMRWSESQPGYLPHVISAFLEWAVILIVCPYFWTFISEFKGYSLSFKVENKRKELQTDV